MLLKALSNARGVSGDEATVRALIAAEVAKTADEYRVDAMGNLIACKRPRAAGRHAPLKVMLAAHMDEIGFIITHIDDAGLLHFEKVGGIDDRILLGKNLLIGAAGVPGVIGSKPRHRTSESERKKTVSSSELVVDIGAHSRADAARVVTPGDYAAFASGFAPMGENCVRGKALDDRVGCALLVELLRGAYPFELYGAFTTQEEIGSRGARAAGYAIDPDIAIILEATISDESPDASDKPPITRLGGGPALTLADRGLLANRRLVSLLAETAQETSIPFQYKQPLVGGTDGGQIHRVRDGVATAVVSVAARYIHSPAAMISMQDYDHTLKLLQAVLPRLSREWST